VYGLSFVFAMLGCAVALMALRRPRHELAWLLALPLLLILPAAPRPAAPTERALVVQPNIDTEMTWTTDTLRETEQRLALLSSASGASVVLWPEVPAPFYPSDAAFREYMAQIAERSKTHFLLGVVDYNSAREPLNSAVMLSPSGQVLDRYDKINLVPFGEFIPPLFGWVNRITHEVGDFVPGNRVVVFPVNDHRVGAFICYESALPGFVRQFVRAGAGVLVNLSNDGYFGHSEAHDQHLAIVRMRAAENRRWIIRATNDGITAVIDPRGRVTERLQPFVETAGMMRYGYVSEQTPYTRYGDWFAWGCLAAALALCAYEWRMTRTSPSLTM
jgi:apolipoprotein N-acyltransferase